MKENLLLILKRAPTCHRKSERSNGERYYIKCLRLEANIKGIKVEFTGIGVIILIISLLFFYLYLVYVYRYRKLFDFAQRAQWGARSCKTHRLYEPCSLVVLYCFLWQLLIPDPFHELDL